LIGADLVETTMFGDTARTFFAASGGTVYLESNDCPMHGKFDTVQVDDVPDTVEHVNPESIWDCCEKPSPRIHEQSGRFFCGSCRHWLDRVQSDARASGDSNAQEARASDAPIDQTPESGASA
jgi:hypothetical protein